MKKMGIIIYARMTSKRFPNKVLATLNNRVTLLELVHNRIRRNFKNMSIIVNTSKNKEDNKIVSLCKKKKIIVFRGSLNNVFDRTKKCLKRYKFKSFVRVNADRPFFDVNLMEKMIKIFDKGSFDIITNQLPKSCPKGLACEIAKSQIFLDIKKNTLIKSEKENIFNYFYKKKNKYKIKNYVENFYKKNKSLNLSIDTKKDFKIAEDFYLKFKNNFYINTKKVINNYKINK